MDWLTFTATVISALAWPAFALFCVLMAAYRTPSLIRFIKTIRYGDIEISLQDARRDVEALRTERGVVGAVTIDPDDKILRLAEIEPAVAIVEIWKKLEEKVTQLIQHNGLIRFTRPDLFVRHLAKLGKISSTELELFGRLRKIRNESVHSRHEMSPTVAEVIEYHDFVDAFCQRLDQIKSEPGFIDIPAKD
jgi:hypothetical protein